ncbi:MAG: hypothetical protein ABWW69_05145 [Pyrodictiaceae archaeon]
MREKPSPKESACIEISADIYEELKRLSEELGISIRYFYRMVLRRLIERV